MGRPRISRRLRHLEPSASPPSAPVPEPVPVDGVAEAPDPEEAPEADWDTNVVPENAATPPVIESPIAQAPQNPPVQPTQRVPILVPDEEVFFEMMGL